MRLRNARLYVVNAADIKLERQATQFAKIAAGSEADFVAYLAGNDAAAAKLGAAPEALGSPARGARRGKQSAHRLRPRAARRSHRRSGGLGRRRKPTSSAWPTTPTRAAPPTWDSIPTCFPDIAPFRPLPACRFPQMLDAAAAGNLRALWVVGSNPAARYANSAAFNHPFLVVQDLFLTETAQACRCLPARGLCL